MSSIVKCRECDKDIMWMVYDDGDQRSVMAVEARAATINPAVDGDRVKAIARGGLLVEGVVTKRQGGNAIRCFVAHAVACDDPR